VRTRAMQKLALLAVTAVLVGCANDDMGEVSLQLATRRIEPMASVQGAAAGQLVVSLGPDEILIDAIHVVLRKIHLDGAPTASCPEDAEGDTDCAEVRLGPVVFDLPLDQGSEPVLSALLPVGTYDRLKFQLHKPSNATGDADLVAEYPEMENTSIRVEGTYNGTAFVFTTDLTEVEEVAFAEPVEVAAEGEVPVTLQVDASGWFVDQAGNVLVDPAQANDGLPFESLVEQNIRASFRAFHDADADGAAD
jgi:hypothetical protein